MGRSIDYADRIYLTTGDTLYSNRSGKMLTILEDTCGRHDALMTPCSLEMFQIVAGNKEYHPSCQENLANAFHEFGIAGDRISTTFNIFMNVLVSQEGSLKIARSIAKPNDYVVLKAEMDLIVGLTACSHEETNSGECKHIEYEIFN